VCHGDRSGLLIDYRLHGLSLRKQSTQGVLNAFAQIQHCMLELVNTIVDFGLPG
jgi:hypothetical protein